MVECDKLRTPIPPLNITSMMGNSNFAPTSDRLIRTALKKHLTVIHRGDIGTRIIEEFGVTHGAARVDIAVVNGSIHGFELKSDIDTLYRLPEQMLFYNSVFDRITLVVGKTHLYEAFKIIPEWWGVIIAKAVNRATVRFLNIREADENPARDSVSIASLLWRQEALDILEKRNQTKGIRSKPRRTIYERLANVLDQDTLRTEVRGCLFARGDWRSEK